MEPEVPPWTLLTAVETRPRIGPAVLAAVRAAHAALCTSVPSQGMRMLDPSPSPPAKQGPSRDSCRGAGTLMSGPYHEIRVASSLLHPGFGGPGGAPGIEGRNTLRANKHTAKERQLRVEPAGTAPQAA